MPVKLTFVGKGALLKFGNKNGKAEFSSNLKISV